MLPSPAPAAPRKYTELCTKAQLYKGTEIEGEVHACETVPLSCDRGWGFDGNFSTYTWAGESGKKSGNHAAIQEGLRALGPSSTYESRDYGSIEENPESYDYYVASTSKDPKIPGARRLEVMSANRTIFRTFQGDRYSFVLDELKHPTRPEFTIKRSISVSCKNER
jgi:hypothetical protein